MDRIEEVAQIEAYIEQNGVYKAQMGESLYGDEAVPFRDKLKAIATSLKEKKRQAKRSREVARGPLPQCERPECDNRVPKPGRRYCSQSCVTRHQFALGKIPGRPPLNEKPVTWEGVTYPSRTKAAAALGISIGRFEHWLRIGQRTTRSNIMKPVEIEGTTFPSAAAAARALGVSVSTVTRWVKNRGRLPKVGGGAIEVTIDGVHYQSIRAAALATGRHWRDIKKIVEKGQGCE